MFNNGKSAVDKLLEEKARISAGLLGKKFFFFSKKNWQKRQRKNGLN